MYLNLGNDIPVSATQLSWVILWNKPLSTNILYFLKYSCVLELYNTQSLEISVCYSLLPPLLHLFQVLTLVTGRHVNLCLVKRRINNYPSLTCPETLDFVFFSNAEPFKRPISVDPAYQNCHHCFVCFRTYHFLATKMPCNCHPCPTLFFHQSNVVEAEVIIWVWLWVLPLSLISLFH